jgi:hypothetical protein
MKEPDKKQTFKDIEIDFDKENVWHVYPINDSKEHIIGKLKICWCNPRIEFQLNKGLLIIHNSKDGREFHEELARKGYHA